MHCTYLQWTWELSPWPNGVNSVQKIVRTDLTSDKTRIVTEPDYDRSTVYIDQRRERITIEHTNDLPKYRCEYPNQAERIAHHFERSEYDCYNSVYGCWYEAYRARGPHKNEPVLRGIDPVDPEHLISPSTSTKVLTKPGISSISCSIQRKKPRKSDSA